MEDISKTSLESALLLVFHELYGNIGFPPPDVVRIVGRTNTSAGRYVDLACDSAIQYEGLLDMQGRYIELNGVENGLMAVVQVKNNRLQDIELAAYGGASWDGQERGWAIV